MARCIPIALLFFLICFVSSDWITISDYSVTTWDPSNANRSEVLTTFKTSNYPSKYIKQLNNRIDTYTYDRQTKTIYFIMQQPLYGISKFFKYSFITNEISQTEEVQSFMIDHIQINPITNELYAIIHGSTQRQYLLVQIMVPMPGSYFNSRTQLFTYHAYNSQQDDTVLITLDLSENATERFVQSQHFDFNVYGFGYIEKGNNLVALWQYSFITPMVVIKIDKQIQNVTITPDGIRVSQGYKPFSMDFQKRQFYVLSWAEDLSTTYISKIYMDTMKVKITEIKGRIIKDYIFFKEY